MTAGAPPAVERHESEAGPPTSVWASHRVAAAVCVVGLVLAVIAVVARDRARRPHYVVTVTTQTAPAELVAADDCPANSTCHLTAVRARVTQLARAAFPGGIAVHADALAPTGRPAVRESLDLLTPDGIRVHVASRCVAGGGSVLTAQTAAVPGIGPVTASVVVPGSPGCSAAVVLQVPAGVAVPWAAAVTLAHRAELQLPG